ncbi:uncharacterized protein TRIADDRAFT_19436 [Trichoplax adhaerens]|uniref:FGFR1 oncogene partner 2 homolog n=1 Tax=Trichoplax adhaerens TaxID=10228 RepID=B3RLU2_TRIAD|nr:hypothetical protein TRIADDRAFT_19436 [Trichoplax adhaerens]EDV28846.1 hypothetical protein TRIADDRAFT_19436 [Trichoplax adhaerens]|eukprot:XP_002108048.1 hypothetical protein TRIADDRAFT_19436 [Trichoplax adhaerens]
MASDQANFHNLLDSAKDLVENLKDQDETITTISKEVTLLDANLQSYNKHRENIQVINEIAKRRPRDTTILNSLKDSERLKALERENAELHEALIDHQLALELIMSKYRQQVISTCPIMDIIKRKSEKIHEMATVIQKAAAVDDEAANREYETIARLRYENANLKELLKIANNSCLSTQ